jgi:trehalose-phosphatase
VCDYDGVLARIVDDPDRAFPESESIEALHSLASLADTHVAVVSGRSLQALTSLSDFSPQIHLVGSHGSEYTSGFERELDESERMLLEEITEELVQLAGPEDGFIVEPKPVSVAFHYRKAPLESGEHTAAAVRHGPATRPGVRVKEGKKVIELAVIDTSKGTALDVLRDRVGADVVLFIGDDVTDEDAFATLSDDDVGIKVGDGPTLARYRVSDIAETTATLALLCELRRSWVTNGPTSESV